MWYLLAACVICHCLQPNSASAAIADGSTITIVQNGVGGVGGGGIFQVTQTTNGSQSFQTFCIERSEHIANNGTYWVSENNGAIGGGESGQTMSNYDPIGSDTAWFYGQFVNHGSSLSSVGFQWGTSSAASDWASALQLVIWRSEGEVNSSWQDLGPYPFSASSSVIADANTLWNTLHATALATGDFHVKALNLWTANITSDYPYLDQNSTAGDSARADAVLNKAAQSQLYYDSDIQNEGLPVPEPSAMLIWGGLAGLGLVFNRLRSRNKSQA
jgi:hypothetical protein